MASFKECLVELLINNKLVTKENLGKAISLQKEKGGALSDILVEKGFISGKDLAFVLSKQLKLPIINLRRYKINKDLVKLIPLKVASQYQIIPVSLLGKTLSIAMVDPLNILTIDYIQSLTGYDINPIIATAKDFSEAVADNYGVSATSAISGILKDMDEVSIELIKEDREKMALDATSVLRLTQEAPVIKITNFVIDQAVKLKASDILIEPLEKRARVRYRIDGILQEMESPPKTMLPAVVSRIKVMSELNVAEHRLPQDGRFKMQFQNREVDFRVSVLPSSFGEKVALRVLDKSTAMLDIEKLGFSDYTIKHIREAAAHPHGMILSCGPTGSGKTTTLYSLLKYIDSPTKNIVTVEDPIEYQLKGINQVNVRPEIGLTFAGCLRSILRQDPDIIMVGEIRDFDTVDIAIKAALTGHLVLSTLHTTTAPGSITRLINMGVEPFLIESSVISIMSQRLVRKICDKCKESYKPPKELVDKLGVKSEGKREILFYRGKGCKNCLDMGYRGRLGLCEILALTPDVKKLILERAQESRIKRLARQEGMQTLREDGIEKVLSGATTLEEALRVTAPDEEDKQV